MISIGAMNSLLIGVSPMEEKQLGTLKTFWENRFRQDSSNAILVPVDIGGSAGDVISSISGKIMEQGITYIGNPVVLAFFTDAREREQAEFLKRMESLPKRLQNALGCTVSVTIIFEYVGAYSVEIPEEAGRQALRENVMDSIFPSARVFLVGRNVLTPESRNWKAETAFLDALCRGSGTLFSELLSGSFGFLSYGDIDTTQREQLEERKKWLEQRIEGGRDSGSLEKEIRAYLERKLEREAQEACKPENNVYPIAPGMFVTGFFAKRKAKRGKNRLYNAACRETEEAVRQTKKDLYSYIMSIADELCAAAEQILNKVIEVSGVGFDVLQDMSVMKSVLSPVSNTRAEPSLRLTGKYEMSEIQNEIYRFLDSAFEFALMEARRKVMQALLNAYNSDFRKKLDGKRSDCRREIAEISNKLTLLPDLNTFCKEVLSGRHFHSVFNPVRADLQATEKQFLLASEAVCPTDAAGDAATIICRRSTGYQSAEALGVFLYDTANADWDIMMKELIIESEAADNDI